MDIKQLNYFIAIIDNHFNLSQAAKQLYITQPALSLVIKEYENSHKLNLFIRHKNRIVGLTPKGQILYEHAKRIIKEHDEMISSLHVEQGEVEQKFSIGIPPYINMATFGEIIPRFIKKYPNIEMTVIEKGAVSIKNLLLEKKIDFAALLYPEEISPHLIDSYTIQETELVVFVSKKHKWAKKKSLTWQDLNQEKLATFNDTFMIPHKLNKEFKKRNTYPEIKIQSSSWDFILNATKANTDLFTVLPSITSNIFSSIKDDFVAIPIEEPIIWRVTLCCLKETQQSDEFNHILNLLLQEFDPEQRG